jgi:acyl phosphate:glycerol-3-phosphate acyltransferase
VHPAVAVILSYVSGSIPSAFLAGKWKGVNLREHGSGNLGATNTIRVLGAPIGITVFAADIAKGFVPVWFLPPQTTTAAESHTWIALACAVAAILGHIRPAFLGFSKGGKGVATACGVWLALAPVQAALALLIFIVVFATSGFVSLGSLTGAIALPVLVAAGLGWRTPIFSVAVLTFAFVFWTHRPNIERLRNGTEYRFAKAANFGRGSSLALGLAVLVLAAAYLAAGVR